MKVVSGEVVDHINGDGLDNRKCNLRVCNRAQNGGNSKLRSNNKSGYRGVSRYKNTLWQVHISAGGAAKRYLGVFKDIKEAAKAYNIAALEYFGEFARLNKIE